MRIEFDWGTKIDDAIALAIHNAKVMKTYVQFEFNGAEMHIIGSTTQEHAKKAYKQIFREKSQANWDKDLIPLQG